MFVDFETVSTTDLKDVGAFKYLEHSTIVCGVFLDDNQCDLLLTKWLLSDDQIKLLENKFNLTITLVDKPRHAKRIIGHNIFGFDRYLWDLNKFPQPDIWEDTMYMALYLGLPGSLEKLASMLFNEHKLQTGNELIKRAQKLKGDYLKFAIFPIVEYCIQDVLLTRKLYYWLQPLIEKYLPSRERKLWEFDYQINKKGLKIDVELAERLVKTELKLKKSLAEKANVDQEDLRSWQRVKNLLSQYNIELPNVNRNTLLSIIDDPELPEEVVDIIHARLANVRITEKKVAKALLALSNDQTIKGMLKYYGAHTGRYTSHLVQIHNLPKPKEVFDYELLKQKLYNNKELTSEESSALIRTIIIPDTSYFYIADYSAIEARILAWIAGEEDILEMYRNHEDLYKDMASRIFNKPVDQITKEERQIGKATVLGCGYQMGIERFKLYCEISGINLSKFGLTPEQVIFEFRRRRPKLAGYPAGEFKGQKVYRGGYWKNIQEDFFYNHKVFKLISHDKYNAIGCELPSGRWMFYRNVNIDAKTYENRYGTMVHIYGGKLTENIVQAVARDVCIYSAMSLWENGFNVKFHVHDEIIIDSNQQTKEIENEIREIMTKSQNDWCDAPLETEIETSKFYKK